MTDAINHFPAASTFTVTFAFGDNVVINETHFADSAQAAVDYTKIRNWTNPRMRCEVVDQRTGERFTAKAVSRDPRSKFIIA